MDQHGGRLLEVFRRFDKDRSGHVDVAELERMLQSLGMSFTAPERRGLLKMFDVNGDGRVSYKEFLDICHQHRPNRGRGMGAKHSSNAAPASPPSPAPSSTTPRSTTQYHDYLSKMHTSSGMATRQRPAASTHRLQSNSSETTKTTKTNKNSATAAEKPTRRAASRTTPRQPAAAAHPDSVQSPEEAEPKLAFSLEFTSVTEQRVHQMAKKSKRHCVQVRKELVILPANRRPRRAALLAASQKAEKYRQSWETLTKLITAQVIGEGTMKHAHHLQP